MVDILAVGAHPDDIEIFMGGAVAVMIKNGLKVGICDLTRGEAGTYGSPGIRTAEAEKAADILGVCKREILSFADGSLGDSDELRKALIEVIRIFKPRVVFCFADDVRRHPDHQEAGKVVQKCCFLSGLEKISTDHPPFRPERVYYFPELIIERRPDFVIDITDFWNVKMEAIEAYSSQVIKQGTEITDSKTFIRSPEFWKILESRGRQAGAMIGTEFGEPFYSSGTVAISSRLRLLN